MAVFTGKATVTITCSTSDATIFYTITDDLASPDVYGTPFDVYKNTTVKSYAVKDGLLDSDTATQEVQVKIPATSSYIIVTKSTNNDFAAITVDPQIVTDFSKHGANLKIRYTLDGTDPTASSTELDISDTLTTGNVTFKWRYFTDNCVMSDVMSTTISGLKVATPVISVA